MLTMPRTIALSPSVIEKAPAASKLRCSSDPRLSGMNRHEAGISSSPPVAAPSHMVAFIAALTGTPDNQVRAIAPEVGGGFGCKINIYGEDYVAAALSKKLGKPLKWIEDRSEAFMTTIHGRDIIGYVGLGLPAAMR